MTATLTHLATRLAALALLSSLVVVALPAEARACSCAPVQTADSVDAAALVFVGHEVSRVNTGDQWPPVAVTFQVVEAYQGDMGSEVTVFTGNNDGDCGLGMQSNIVGITAYWIDGDLEGASPSGSPRAAVDLCGSLHNPADIAALLEPIELSIAVPPATADADPGSGLLWVIGGGLVVLIAGGAALVVRSRRRDWHDGWNSAA